MLPHRADVDHLGLELLPDAPLARLPVVERLCAPFGFLYGGTGLAACAVAAEAVTGRPLVWITTQYVANAWPGEVVELAVDVVVEGRATSQTHVRGTVGERTVLHATTAHTDRPIATPTWWGEPPAVAGPEDSPPLDVSWAPSDRPSFFDQLDRRLPEGQDALLAAGRVAMWSRMPSWPIGSPASQGFVADIVPMALAMALGREPGGTSLDNTVRIVVDEPPQDEGWVLLDIESEGFGRSIGHGRVRLWRPNGTLIGIGSQSCIIRTSHHTR